MEIVTSVRRLYISFKSLVNDFVYSFGRAALLLLVEVQNHTVPVRERRRIRDNKVNNVPGDIKGVKLGLHLQLISNLLSIFGKRNTWVGVLKIFQRKFSNVLAYQLHDVCPSLFCTTKTWTAVSIFKELRFFITTKFY